MSKNTLTASELLTNKGIRSETWRKWDRTVETLQCTGQKQYEPNNSWLQNKQKEKGLEYRRNSIGIERVNRNSQLASAEWLPRESRARVTKKSGQEWTCFGLEDNLELYLIPEEALLLLELNCLQLTWNGVPLSIQQAYRVLIDSDPSECSIEEYRVYSHLVRQGYRLQRFRYQDSFATFNTSTRSQRWSSSKQRKQHYDRSDGFVTTTNRVRADVSGEASRTGAPDEFRYIRANVNRENSKHPGTCGELALRGNEFETEKRTVSGLASVSETVASSGVELTSYEDGARNILRDSATGAGRWFVPDEDDKLAIGNFGAVKKLPSELYDNGAVNLPGPSNVDVKKIVRNNGKDSKLQIISDETLLGDFKMISKWPGTRIQRNVKWMPKRQTSKIVPTVLETIVNGRSTTDNVANEGSSAVEDRRTGIMGEPNFSNVAVDFESAEARKEEPTHEVIEVSDDEIEELPQELSRMEMLNLFPDVVSQGFVTKRIARKYLPRNVWPQKISNRFIEWKLPEGDRRSHAYRLLHARHGSVQNYAATSRHTIHDERYGDRNERLHGNVSTKVSFPSPGPKLSNVTAGHIWRAIRLHDSTPVGSRNECLSGRKNEITRQGFVSYKNAFGCNEIAGQYRDQTVSVRGSSASWSCRSNAMTLAEQNRVSLKSSVRASLTIAPNVRGKLEFRRRNIWTNASCYSPNWNAVHFIPGPGTTGHRLNSNRNVITGTARCPWDNRRCPSPATDIGNCSFKIVPGAVSWSETKAKWTAEKMTRIQDKDRLRKDRSTAHESAVATVARPVEPLVGKQNATSLAKIYGNLRIIKPTTDKNLEHIKKKPPDDRRRISYNMYSTTQHYKKANPGIPMYRIVILRSEDTPFVESTEMEHLQKDARGTPILFACVSHTTVTFAELGTVKIPETQDNWQRQ